MSSARWLCAALNATHMPHGRSAAPQQIIMASDDAASVAMLWECCAAARHRQCTLLEIWPVLQIWYTPANGPMALATSLEPCTKDMAHAENTCVCMNMVTTCAGRLVMSARR